MNIPLFRHTPELFHKVKEAGILFSETSLLKLNCFKESGLGIAEKNAVSNFYAWQTAFTENCEKAFASGNPELKQIYRPLFEHELLNCLFVAELFDWHDYNSLTAASYTSFFEWQNGRLVNTRRLKNLLALDQFAAV